MWGGPFPPSTGEGRRGPGRGQGSGALVEEIGVEEGDRRGPSALDVERVGGTLGEMAGGHAAALMEGGDHGRQSASALTARWGPKEDAMSVASSRPVPLSARERLRDHQAAAAKAVASHATSTARLHAVLSRRAKVMERQDALVEAATADLEAAVAAVARAFGIDVAAEVLGLNKTEVRRVSKDNP